MDDSSFYYVYEPPSFKSHGMIIAIDYDGTFSRDPEGWAGVIHLLRRAGHKVIVATGNSSSKVEKAFSVKGLGALPIIRGKPKFDACLKEGYRVDIWIENEPMHVHMSQKEWEQFHKERGLGKVGIPRRQIL